MITEIIEIIHYTNFEQSIQYLLHSIYHENGKMKHALGSGEIKVYIQGFHVTLQFE